MKKQNTWNQANPNDAKIMALTTKLQKLENQVACYATGASTTSQDKNANKSSKPTTGGIEKWRMKYEGPTKTVNGIQYWWCPHRKLPGQFDGLMFSTSLLIMMNGRENVMRKDSSIRRRSGLVGTITQNKVFLLIKSFNLVRK